MGLTETIYRKFNFNYKVELSTRPEDAMGSAKLWDLAEKNLENALKEMGVDYEFCSGEGAFYGPKIDFHIEDSLGRSWQCGTIQLDFFMPENFELEYTGEDGTPYRPIIIHRAIMGSIERFMGIVIEHFAGALPVWLAPVQTIVIPISDRHVDSAKKIYDELIEKEIRTELDISSNTLNKKLKNAEERKVPYMLIIGDKEIEHQTISVRKRGKGDVGSQSLIDFFSLINEEIKGYV
jgi:threonyl-tRNA synthetase